MRPSFLTDEFLARLEQALEMMAGEKPSLEGEPAPPPAIAPGLIVWEQRFSAEGAVSWVAGPESVWIEIGAHLLRAAGIEEHDAPTAKSTFIEILNQSFAGVAHAASTSVHRDIKLGSGSEIKEVPENQSWFQITLRFAGADPYRLHIAFNAALIAFLSKSPETAMEPRPGTVSLPGVQPTPPAFQSSRTLDLLLDVELPVSVSFGRAQLALKDVIKLTSGSIVELNRSIGEPVEIIVNNCVIARGEVVVVEGNFGVRIQQVISKQERLRTLY
jgi:flagellar motor switch protein FliN